MTTVERLAALNVLHVMVMDYNCVEDAVTKVKEKGLDMSFSEACRVTRELLAEIELEGMYK